MQPMKMNKVRKFENQDFNIQNAPNLIVKTLGACRELANRGKESFRDLFVFMQI